MNLSRIVRGLLVLALVSLAGGASAQNLSRTQMRALRAACEADARTVCAGVQPGGGRIIQCFRANPDKVSPPCKDALMAAKAATAAE